MSLKVYFRKFQLIHTAISIMSALTLAVAFLLRSNDILQLSPLEDTVNIFLLIGVVMCMFGSSFLYRRLTNYAEGASPEVIIQRYGTAKIIQMAILEVAIFLSALHYLFNNNWVFLLFGTIILLLSIYQRPTPINFIQDMGLSDKEWANKEI